MGVPRATKPSIYEINPQQYKRPTSPHSGELKLGIVIGISVSCIFFLVFVLACIIVAPCKCKKLRKPKNQRTTHQQEHLLPSACNADSYLYLEKTKQLTSSSGYSSSDQSKTDCSTSTESKGISIALLFGKVLFNLDDSIRSLCVRSIGNFARYHCTAFIVKPRK